MGTLSIKTAHKQQQTLTPRLQHAVRLLQLSSLDFAQEVQAVLDKNPFLDVAEDDEAGLAPMGPAQTMPEPITASEGLETPPALANDGIELPALGDTDPSTGEEPAGAVDDFERESWQLTGASPRQSGDGETSIIDLMADHASLRQHLHTQLNVMHLSERDLLIARVIVESLDDDGYLREELDDLRALCEIDPPPDMQDMLRALEHVQMLDPVGVGARSVAETLLIQLRQLPCQPDHELARVIVERHMDRLVRHDVCGLARELGCSAHEVEAACNCIRRLDPRPGWRLGSTVVQYITPDVIVRKVRGEWTVSLSSSIVPRVRLNQMYADLFQRHRNGKHSELAAHLQEARWTIRNVEQRFATILQVSEAIIRRQKNFLEYGALAMRPMALKEIAEEVGLHESTVSRVTNNKYMSTPVGVFELKYFFSRAMATATGGTCSATAIRGVIQTMIDEETPCSPLSDAEIARRLARQGLNVARRTVTKYRQAMRIAPVEHRRRVA